MVLGNLAEEHEPDTADPESALHILFPVVPSRRTLKECAQTAGDRFDGRERVVQFVTEHAHDALPGLQFPFAQRAAQIRDDDQEMAATTLAKFAAAQTPATGARADSLARFMHAYARLARLPPPQLTMTALRPLVHRVVALESRVPIELQESSDPTLACDAAQVEQLIINLVKNAVDAVLEHRSAVGANAGVRLRWRAVAGTVEVIVEDDGPGIAQTTNLFVPFFTTKAEGSGIGLVLFRQIAENHGGTLTLSYREHASGCIATLHLPI